MAVRTFLFYSICRSERCTDSSQKTTDKTVSNPDGNFDPEADHGSWFPVAGVKDKVWLGYKYFNFGDAVVDGATLNLELIEEAPATVNVYCAEPRAHAADTEPEKTLIGTATLTGDNAELHEVAIPVDAAALAGRKAIYLEFRSEAYEDDTAMEICQINRLRFAQVQ